MTGAELPARLVDTLAEDAAATLGSGRRLPGGPAAVVSGPAADRLAWLLGRADGSALAVAAGPLPTLPRWL